MTLNMYLPARKCLENISSAMKDFEKSLETNKLESLCSDMNINVILLILNVYHFQMTDTVTFTILTLVICSFKDSSEKF